MIRSLLIFLPATLMPRLAAFVLSLIGANILSAQEFGYFALVIVIGEMSEMSAVGWTRVLLIRFGSSGGGGLAARTLKKMSLASSGALFVALFVAMLMSYILAPERFGEMVVSTCAYIVAFGTLRVGLTTLQIEGRRATYSVIESVRAPLFVVGVALVMRSTDSFSFASTIGSAVVFCMGAIALLIGWRNAEETDDDIMAWGTIFRAGLPIILISVLSYIVVSLDKMILSTNFNKDVVAIYAIAFALGRQGFDVLANAINVHAFPLLVRRHKKHGTKGTQEQVQATFALLLAATLPAAGVLIACRDFIADLILPEIYHEAIHVALPIVASGAIFMNLKNFCFDNIFHVFEKNYFQLPTLAIGAGVSIAVAFWSPTEHPLISIALIYASGALASLISSLIISRRFLVPKMPWFLIGVLVSWACLAYLAAYELVSTSTSELLICGLVFGIAILFMAGGLVFYRRYENSILAKECDT